MIWRVSLIGSWPWELELQRAAPAGAFMFPTDQDFAVAIVENNAEDVDVDGVDAGGLLMTSTRLTLNLLLLLSAAV